MPTISGLRRRGFPAEGIRDFATEIGVAKADSVHEIELLEHAVRDVLEPDGAAAVRRARPAQGGDRRTSPRARSRRWRSSTTPRTRRPATRQVDVRRASCGSSATTSWRSRRRSSSGWRRAARCGCGTRTSSPARRSSRTRPARVVELRCTYDPATRGGDSPDGRKVKATLHWVSAAHAVPAEVRLYDHLFTRPDPGADGDLFADLNPASETIVRGAMLEPSLADASPGETVQFERLGYFTPDSDSRPGALGVQPDADAQGLLGEGPGEALVATLEFDGMSRVRRLDDLEAGLHEALVTEALRARIERARADGWLVEWKGIDDAASRRCSLGTSTTEPANGSRPSQSRRRTANREQVALANRVLEALGPVFGRRGHPDILVDPEARVLLEVDPPGRAPLEHAASDRVSRSPRARSWSTHIATCRSARKSRSRS